MIAACLLCGELVEGLRPAVVPRDDTERARAEAEEYRLLCHELTVHLFRVHVEEFQTRINAVMTTAAWVFASKCFISADARYPVLRSALCSEFADELSTEPAASTVGDA